jgi:hypothetical protein
MSFFGNNGQSPPTNTCNCTDSNGNQCTPQKSSSWWPFSGGRRRRTVRRGGGFRPYTDQNSASTASPFSGGKTAQPHQWTGGKRRRRRGTKRKRNCSKCNSRKRHRH